MVKLTKKTQRWVNGIILAVIILMIVSLILGAFTSVSYLEGIRIVFGSIYVLFLPGFLISYIFFPKTQAFEEKKEKREKGAIDWIERIALSFALSIAIVPLAVFYLNLIGVKINLLNSFLTILGIIIVAVFIILYRNKKLKDLN